MLGKKDKVREVSQGDEGQKADVCKAGQDEGLKGKGVWMKFVK